jgi:hypothetical protein
MALRKFLPLVLSSLCTLLSLIAAPAASAAGTVATTRGCFVAEGTEGTT